MGQGMKDVIPSLFGQMRELDSTPRETMNPSLVHVRISGRVPASMCFSGTRVAGFPQTFDRACDLPGELSPALL